MIKKIHVGELEPGMFIYDYTREITDTRSSIKQLLIKDKQTIETIYSWGIKEVYIDTERGRKVKRAQTVEEVQKLINIELHEIAKKNIAAPKKVPFKKEIKLAKSIKKEGINILQRALQTSEKGTPIDVNAAYKLIRKMEQSVNRNHDALILLTRIKKKDEYTLMHSLSVGSLVLAFCNFCHVPHKMTMNLAVGALFHDLGKTMIPSCILNKPGKLTDSEFHIMKKHAEYSEVAMYNTSGLPLEAHDIAMHHHEKYDGSGYPHGLKGDEISFGSQVTAICDVYDAVTSNRCYQDGIDSSEGLRIIYECSNFHFNKELAHKFIRCIGVYPIGTYVKLENDMIGIVVESTTNILQPVVRVFYDDQKKSAAPIEDLNLLELGIDISSYEPPNKWQKNTKRILTDLFK